MQKKRCIPVLLVKKDGTWTFCVDYYYLNDLTVKGTFPIPAFNQLMDEVFPTHAGSPTSVFLLDTIRCV